MVFREQASEGWLRSSVSWENCRSSALQIPLPMNNFLHKVKKWRKNCSSLLVQFGALEHTTSSFSTIN